jgi:hypothetical protein
MKVRFGISKFTCAIIVFFGMVAMVAQGVFAAEDIQKYIEDIKSGPTIYYTPEAAAYFAATGNYGVSGLSSNKDAAIRSFRATIKLGGTPLASARDAVPTLLDIFPKAVHYVEIRQARYAGEGTFDDCVSTYVMSAKNQFLLSSPFLDYNSLSLCDAFIDGLPTTDLIDKETNRQGTITSALFNLKITFTFYAGECALSRMTGMSLGHDPSAWRQWWLTSSSAAYSTPATYAAPASPGTATPTANPYVTTVTVPGNAVTPAAAPAAAQGAAADIGVGGKYRIFLNTGDDFTGTIESKNDSSFVIETTNGKPYVITNTLVSSVQMIEPPKPKAAPQGVSGKGEIVSYDELQNRAVSNPYIDVKIDNGSNFRGRLLSMDAEGLKMDIEGSRIPISKNTIKRIIVLPGAPQTAPAPSLPVGPFDTVWTKNPETDNWGTPKPDLCNIGAIIDEGDNYVTLKGVDGGVPKKILRSAITRFNRHSSDNSDEAIKRYAKQLVCPGDMFLVNLAPGRGSKPFFKVCVDKYEFPDKLGTKPKIAVSYEDAKKFCEQQGKRLCTAVEWEWACGGMDDIVYPYGKTFDQERCNSNPKVVEESGNRINCVSSFGGYDMVGNIFEWVTAKDGSPALMGGPLSKCQTVSPGGSGDAKPQSGLRCCKSN